MSLTLSDETRATAIESIRQYFLENMDREIGDLKAMLLLDFFLEEIAPSVYNHAIADAQRFMNEKVDDMGATCYMGEFAYWKR